MDHGIAHLVKIVRRIARATAREEVGQYMPEIATVDGTQLVTHDSHLSLDADEVYWSDGGSIDDLDDDDEVLLVQVNGTFFVMGRQTKSSGQASKTAGARATQSETPDTTGWDEDDLWYDTSTETSAVSGTWRRWTGSQFLPSP